MSIVISDIKNPYTTSGSITNWTYLADIRNISNMYPYGKSYPAAVNYTATEDYGYGYNGMEKAKKVDDNTNHTHFRNLDLDFGRWWSRDPLEVCMPYQSPYNSMGSNPINRIDPTGDADYYSQDGTMVGSNDPSDQNSYLLVDENDVELAEDGIFDSFTGRIITFPIDENINAIKDAKDRVEEPTGDDLDGGHHEEGIMVGTNDKNENLIVNMKPGPYIDITKGIYEVATIDMTNPIDADKDKYAYLWANLNNVLFICHIHNTKSVYKMDPRTSKISIWSPGYEGPSQPDVDQVQSYVTAKNVNWLWMVVGKDYIYFYGTENENNKGERHYAKFPLDEFFELAE